MNERCRVEVFNRSEWTAVSGLNAVRAGQVFRMFEPNETTCDLGYMITEGVYEVAAHGEPHLVQEIIDLVPPGTRQGGHTPPEGE